MGFSGGGSNVLKNHKHDATVVQDGGSLDADNVTSADLTQGDVIFSDGTHLQRLAIGTPAQQIQVNAGATAPEWATSAAGVNNRVILDSQIFTNDTTNTITFTPGTPIDDSVYQKIQVVFTGDGLGNTITRAKFNLDAGLLNTDYFENSIEVYNGSASYVNKNPQDPGDVYVRLTDVLANGGETWIATVDVQLPSSGQDRTSIYYQVATHDRVANGSGYVINLNTPGAIERFQISMDGNLAKDMQFTVYGIKH
tara:strand:+ start:211 stop:969 length:759 start_codon:yes stop_codon:yes gene_type:complete